MRYMQENNDKVPLIEFKILPTYLNTRPSDALPKIKDVSFHISFSYSVGSRTCHEVTLVTAC